MSHLKRNLIQAFLDQELSDKEKNLVEIHLSACSGCRSKLQRAASERNWIMSELALLNPDRIPPRANLTVHSKEIGKNRFMKKFIFAPVKVPSFSLIVLGSIIIILAGLLYFEKSKIHAFDHGQPQESNENIVTIIADNEIESIPFIISSKNFVPLKEPRILSHVEYFNEK